jgi:Winged helix-turn-helix DNA-binding
MQGKPDEGVAMSLLDQVRKLEQQVVDRLKELEPLTREYDQLRKVAERLGLKYSPGSPKAGDEAAPSKTARGGGKRAGAGKRAARRSAKAQPAQSRSRAAKPKAKARGARSTTAPRATATAEATGARATPTPADTPTRAATSRQRSGGRRAAVRPGQRHDDVLRLVGENPGITVREIGERLGVDATGLYRVAKRLTDEGRLRKDGPRLYPEGTATAPSSEASAGGASQTPASRAAETPQATAPAASKPSTTAAETGTSGQT